VLERKAKGMAKRKYEKSKKENKM